MYHIINNYYILLEMESFFLFGFGFALNHELLQSIWIWNVMNYVCTYTLEAMAIISLSLGLISFTRNLYIILWLYQILWCCLIVSFGFIEIEEMMCFIL